jgi:hypothetical protein
MEMKTATREELQAYLEGRGFAVYDHEDIDDLRTAAMLDQDGMVKATCDHKPDEHTFSYSGSELIIDVNCRECGMSGSFAVSPGDINWE